MNIKEYEDSLDEFCKYPSDQELTYLALGLSSEAGEVADKIKKHIRDRHPSDPIPAEELALELGDVLFYLTRLADYIDLGIEEIAERNHKKLSSRLERDKIHGTGDYR